MSSFQPKQLISSLSRLFHWHLAQSGDCTDSEYSCPVCAQDVKRFLPLDPFFTENRKKYGNPYPLEDAETINPAQYQCPICGSSDRDRLYAMYMAKQLFNGPSERTIKLLDIASSQSLRAFLLEHPQVAYQSADKYMDGVDVVADITDMHMLPAESFDFFICSHVLEHVPDDRKALSELFRVLKPGGSGILMVPINLRIKQIDEDPSVTDVGERWRRFGQNDHIRLYSKQGFLDRVNLAGFAIDQYGVDYFGADAFSRHGISRSSVLYVVRKS